MPELLNPELQEINSSFQSKISDLRMKQFQEDKDNRSVNSDLEAQIE